MSIRSDYSAWWYWGRPCKVPIAGEVGYIFQARKLCIRNRIIVSENDVGIYNNYCTDLSRTEDIDYGPRADNYPIVMNFCETLFFFLSFFTWGGFLLPLTSHGAKQQFSFGI